MGAGSTRVPGGGTGGTLRIVEFPVKQTETRTSPGFTYRDGLNPEWGSTCGRSTYLHSTAVTFVCSLMPCLLSVVAELIAVLPDLLRVSRDRSIASRSVAPNLVAVALQGRAVLPQILAILA